MLAVLLESKARPVRRRGGAVLSVVAHTAVILGAVVATGLSSVDPSVHDTTDIHGDRLLLPLSPPAKARGAKSAKGSMHQIVIDGSRLSFDPAIHDSLPAIDSILTRGAAVDPNTITGPARPLGGGESDTGGPLAGPYLPNQVERLASLVRAATPVYPEMLRRAGVPGHVLVRFIVGTNGVVEPLSVEVRESTHPAFEQAVRAVLPRLRFAPAEAGGRQVRLLVELPFDFALDRR